MKVSAKEIDKISILLIDDHQMLLDLWAFIIARDGRFTLVGKATGGKQAVELARSKRPDVVVLDINIGDPDGFEVTKMIKRILPASKIIGMSMYVLPAYAKKMKTLGAMGYVTKSSPAEELVKAIIEVYNGRPYFCRQIQNLMKAEDELASGKKSSFASLTGREIEIIQLIAKGLTTKQIAAKLFLSPKTIHIHRHNILKKLNVKNVTSLVSVTQTLGL